MVELVTTTTAMTRLCRGRDQVIKLVDSRLLPESGRYGRARLLKPGPLAALAARHELPDVGAPPAGSEPGVVEPYALGLHLGPRARDRSPHNGRRWVGWKADGRTRDEAWTGWWNVGVGIAAAVTRAQLPLLPAVSGFVVDVRVIQGFTVHPVFPGQVQFLVSPAPEELRRYYSDAVFLPAPGPPWQRLWRPVGSRAGSVDAGSTAPTVAQVRVDEPVRLRARARRWLLDNTAHPARGADRWEDCPRGLVAELVAAGLVEEFRGPGHERGRWAGVRITDAGWDEGKRLRGAGHGGAGAAR